MTVLIFVAGFLVAALGMMLINRREKDKLNQINTSLSNDISAKQREIEMLNGRLEDCRQQYERQLNEKDEQFARQMKELDARNEKEKNERSELMEKKFSESLRLVQEQLRTATEQLLKERSKELDDTNRTQMGSILAPLKAVMEQMKKSMDDNRESFTRSTASLGEQLRQMQATTTNLGAEAEKLSKALQTGPKVQGDFGEMKLNDLLDKFGFTKGIEYDVQYTMHDEKGKVIRNDDTDDMMRPDVVLHYPDHRDVIIDSKASLTAYINYVNAENDEDRKRFVADHLKSVRKHIDELAAKGYNKYSMEGGTTLDFVIMFVPHEAAMQLAVFNDPTLWHYAFDKNVLITGEQNLFALLRLLQMAWTQQKQANNQKEVFKYAGLLVERVGRFVERFEKIGKSIENVQKSYDDANKSLNGSQSFMVSARKLIDMGAKENKNRPLPKPETEDEE